MAQPQLVRSIVVRRNLPAPVDDRISRGVQPGMQSGGVVWTVLVKVPFSRVGRFDGRLRRLARRGGGAWAGPSIERSRTGCTERASGGRASPAWRLRGFADRTAPALPIRVGGEPARHLRQSSRLA